MLAASSSKALWFLTRGTGMVSLVLLTVSVALGVAELVRFASPRWPRFVVAALHRNVALLATAFLAVHIVTAIIDPFASIRLVDVVVPFVGAYRPLWLGLGAVAIDLFLALIVTSLLRERIGHRAWRAIHWVAYASWPIALLHGLGTGSDTRTRWAVFVNVGCVIAVVAAVLVRVGWTHAVSFGRRAVAGLASVGIAAGVVGWMFLEPMRPGWARKAGTPSALLASTSAGLTTAGSDAGVARIPIPFTSATQGSVHQSSSDGSGVARVTITATLDAIPGARLRVVIEGAPVDGGGVRMQKGFVRLGVPGAPDLYHGGVVSLDGSNVVASLRGPNDAHVSLSMDFTVDANASAVGGTVSAQPGGTASGI